MEKSKHCNIVGGVYGKKANTVTLLGGILWKKANTVTLLGGGGLMEKKQTL